MNVREVMTADPVCCTADTPLTEVAKMMVECDCGAIPVVDSQNSKKPVGMITDRDITIRTVAVGLHRHDEAVGRKRARTLAQALHASVAVPEPDRAARCIDRPEAGQVLRLDKTHAVRIGCVRHRHARHERRGMLQSDGRPADTTGRGG